MTIQKLNRHLLPKFFILTVLCYIDRFVPLLALQLRCGDLYVLHDMLCLHAGPIWHLPPSP